MSAVKCKRKGETASYMIASISALADIEKWLGSSFVGALTGIDQSGASILQSIKITTLAGFGYANNADYIVLHANGHFEAFTPQSFANEFE